MQGPVEAEINRSSKISPSIAPTVSWRRETPRFLAATARVDGDDRVVFHGGVQRRSDEQNPRPTLSLALPRRRRGGAGGAARDHAQDRAFHRVRRARGALVRGPHARARTVAAARGVGGAAGRHRLGDPRRAAPGDGAQPTASAMDVALDATGALAAVLVGRY